AVSAYGRVEANRRTPKWLVGDPLLPNLSGVNVAYNLQEHFRVERGLDLLQGILLVSPLKLRFASHKLNLRAVKMVLFLLLAIPPLKWLALRASLAIKVRQAEVLLSQVKALRVRES